MAQTGMTMLNIAIPKSLDTNARTIVHTHATNKRNTGMKIKTTARTRSDIGIDFLFGRRTNSEGLAECREITARLSVRAQLSFFSLFSMTTHAPFLN